MYAGFSNSSPASLSTSQGVVLLLSYTWRSKKDAEIESTAVNLNPRVDTVVYLARTSQGGQTSFSRNWLAKLCKNRRAVKNGWNVINLMFDRLFLQL